MPITGPSSWLSTIDEFSAHWVQVNAALTAPLVLTTAYAVATLGTARTTLSTSMTTLSTGINDRQIAEATVVQSEATARGKIGDFNRAVRAFLGTTAYAPALGDVPAKGAAQGKYEKAMDDTSSLWVKINSVTLPTFTPPLVLRGGYTQGSFGTLVSSLKVAYTTATAAGRNEKVQLELRNAAFDVIRPRLVEYRKAVIELCAGESAGAFAAEAVSAERDDARCGERGGVVGCGGGEGEAAMERFGGAGAGSL